MKYYIIIAFKRYYPTIELTEVEGGYNVPCKDNCFEKPINTNIAFSSFSCKPITTLVGAVRTKFTWIKGTVSRDLRWILLYINRKLFARAIVAHHKMLILLKGHFTIKIEDLASERLGNSRWSAQFYIDGAVFVVSV